MKLGVVIPWREEESRIRPLEYLINWYSVNLPDAKVYYADKPGKWQHSGSRNLGVKMAQQEGCDIIICNDADTIPELQSLLSSIESAKNDLFVHNPYKECNYLNKEATQKVFDGQPINALLGVKIFNWVCGGIFVFQPEAWWKLGGMDEKIYTGPEDLVFERVHQVINGTKIIKHPGSIYCFWHERIEKETKEDWDREAYNQALYSEYLATNDPQQILKLVARDH